MKVQQHSRILETVEAQVGPSPELKLTFGTPEPLQRVLVEKKSVSWLVEACFY